MSLTLLVLIGLVNAEARDLDLLDGGAQEWSTPSRVTKCPVHSEIQPVANLPSGVSFVVKVNSGKRFSVVEKYLPAGGLQGYEGLQLNFTTSGLGSWKLRVYDSTCRFAYYINKPDGAHSLTLPWSSFGKESRRRRKTVANGYSIQPSSISHLAVVLPIGTQQAQLTLEGMHAMRDLSAMGLAATAAAKDNMVEGFDGPFVGMGISGHNDFAMISVNNPAECAEECTKIAECRSFDYGARGQVTNECWLSLADRTSAGYAYQSWPLYNYYEVKGASPNAASAMIIDTGLILSKDDMAAVMGYFEGPFVGMGITGHNDFPMMAVNDAAECAEACTRTAECSSFDYGARGQVSGECWLSRADRESVGDAFQSWKLYDYYEMKAAGNTAANTAKEDAKMEDAMRQGDTSASHAQRLSPKPMASVQAVGALVFFMAWVRPSMH